jgi:TRAP-type C4-dicarboxylate transport system substrate-binding protein
MNGSTRFSRLLISLVMTIVVAACGRNMSSAPVADPVVDKAGADLAPAILRLGTADDEGRPGGEQVRRFAAEVLDRSGGRIVIEPVWNANGTNYADWDQIVARKVIAGDDLDMGLIPSRAWDTEGVSTLRALQTPFLVTSNAMAAKVATSDLSTELMAGLTDVGITGLALVPEDIRYLFAFGEPPMTIDDYQRLHVRAPTSNATAAMLEALGMIPDDYAGPDEPILAAIDAGLSVAAESSFALANLLPRPTTAIGNVPLFPKVNSLVINSAAYDRMTDGQRAVLRDAATAMAASWIATMTPTATDAETYCRNGGAVVMMAERDRRDLRRAVQPVVSDLRHDPTTKSLIDRIGALARGIGAEDTEVAACERLAADTLRPDPSVPTAATVEFPEGVYRKTVTAEFLVSQGIDRPTAENHAGTWTLTFRDGQFLDPGCPDSTYEVIDGRIIVTLGPVGRGCGSAAGNVLFTAGWTLDGDQLLFTDVRAGDGSPNPLGSALFGRQPLTKLR